jgi:hypothetical protein
MQASQDEGPKAEKCKKKKRRKKFAIYNEIYVAKGNKVGAASGAQALV